MENEISARFRALAKTLTEPSHDEQDLAEGALVLAAEARPGVDLEPARRMLAALVESARPQIDACESRRAAVETLNRFLFVQQAFRGDREHYEDPRNSFLDEVLARRRGLPITLSILYVEVARRLGLEAHGIGFPGHFLAKVTGVDERPDGEILVDPFFGRSITRTECAERLRAAVGEEVDLDPAWLRPATAREIYVRMLNNLKRVYLRRGDGISALGCFDRILLLAPDSASEYRDRGLLLEGLDCILAALDDYERFLALAPQDETAGAIRMRRDALAQRRPALN